MASFRSLRSEINVLGLLLLVYSMSMTGVSPETTSITAIASATLVTPTESTQAASILPTATALPTTSTASAKSTVTQAPVIKPTAKPTTPSSGRKFDGASFIGGIILGIVLTGIIIFTYKWWQSRNKSYHSL